jgi:hypothetical protein
MGTGRDPSLARIAERHASRDLIANFDRDRGEVTIITVTPGMFDDHGRAIVARTCLENDAIIGGEDGSPHGKRKIDSIVANDPEEGFHTLHKVIR